MKRLAALTAFFILLCSNLGAATYYVSQAGGEADAHACSTTDSAGTNRLTIAAGILCLSPGDTLRIHAGTYTQSQILFGPSGVNDGTRTTIEGYPSEVVTIVNGFNIYSKSFMTVRNIVTTGAANRIGRGVATDAASTYITLDSVEAKNWAPGPSSTGGAGIMAGFHQESVSSNILILNCSSHNNGGNKLDHGVYIQARDVTVSGGSFYSNTGHGVHVYSGISGATNNAVVKGVRAYSNGSYGIGLMAGINLQAYNNIVYSNGALVLPSGGIGLRLGGRGALYNNTAYNNTGFGIRNEDYTTNIVTNNIAYLNSVANLSFAVTPTNSNNITANPLFVDTTDFELGAGSPAIGAALDLSTTIGNTDFDGTVRTGGWDVGAQEVSAATESLTLLTPAGGTLGVTGSSQTLTYGSSGLTFVRLRYDDNGISFPSPTVLSTSTAATGSFAFTAPAAGTTYRFEVCKTDGTLCSYSSSDVIITASSGGTLTKIISNNTTGSFIGDITGVEDNEIAKSVPTTNKSTLSPMGVYKYSSTSHSHTLLNFSGLSQIPTTATLTSVTLGLYVQGGSGATAQTFDVRRLLRTWGPTTANWNTYDGTNAWTTAGALGAATDRTSTALAQLTSVDLTAQYRTVTQTSGALFDWAQGVINLSISNQGLHVERNGSGEDTTYRDITSSEGTDGQRPYISVTYTVTTPTITLTQPTAGEHLYPGDTMAIRWLSSDFSGNVIGTLSLNNGVSYDNTIVASHPYNQPDATWVVAISPTISASTQAKVKVCSITSPTVCSESPAFKIAGTRR